MAKENENYIFIIRFGEKRSWLLANEKSIKSNWHFWMLNMGLDRRHFICREWDSWLDALLIRFKGLWYYNTKKICGRFKTILTIPVQYRPNDFLVNEIIMVKNGEN